MQKTRLTLFVALLVSCGGAPPTAPPAPTKFPKLQEARISDIQTAAAGQANLDHRTAGRAVPGAHQSLYNGTCVVEPEASWVPIKTIKNAGQINALATLNLRPLCSRHMVSTSAKAPQHDGQGGRRSEDARRAGTRGRCKTRNSPRPASWSARCTARHVHKDQYDTFDMRTTSGADAFYANDPPTGRRHLRQAPARRGRHHFSPSRTSAIRLGSFRAVPSAARSGNPYDNRT